MADVKFDIEVTGIKELKQAADNFNRLGKVSSQLAAQYKPLGAQTTKIVQEHTKFNRVQKQLNAAVAQGVITQKEADRALQETLRTSRERILTDKTLIDQAKKRKKAEEDARKETARLTKEYAPARAAADLYKKKVQEITQAQRRNIISEQEARRSLQLLTREYYNFTQGAATGGNQFAKFNVETYKANQRLKRFTSTGLQQAGYQIGDFAVQVQSGTNVAVAFGQQFSQLAGIFGPTGALVGAGVAIATAFVAPLIDARNAAKKVDKALQDLQSTVSDLSSVEATLREVFELPFFGANQALVEYLENLKEVKFQETVKGIRSGFEQAGQAAQDEIDRLRDRKDELNENLASQRELIAVNKSLYESGNLVLSKEQADSMFSNMSDAALELRNEVGKTATSIALFEEDLRSVAEATKATDMDDLIEKMAALKAEIDASESMTRLYGEAFDKVADSMGLTEAIQDRITEAARTQLEITEGLKEATSGYKNEMQGVMEHMARMSIIAASRKGGSRGTVIPTAVDAMLASLGGFDFKYDDNKNKGKSQEDKLAEYIQNLQTQRNKEKQLVGIFDEQRDLMGSLIDARQKYGDIATDSQMKIIEGYIQETHALEQQQKALEKAKEQQGQLKETIESSMEDAFMSIVDGTKTVEDAFREMARQIIAELMRVLVVKQMVSAATSFFGFADGGAFQSGSQIQAYAKGGIVGGPTYFPMSGGRTGLMGEAGPEAIMPLKRGKNGKLGVESSGQGNNIVINQSFNFAANGDDSVKRIIASEAPKIAKMTEAQILDNSRRGGQFRKAFA